MSTPARALAEPVPAGFRSALTRLGAAQKSPKGAPAYSLYVNRPLGRRLAALAYALGVTPNSITYLSAGATFLGIVALAALPITWWTGLVVALLLVVGYALDAADGQLARLRGGGSISGEWLDHMVDAGKSSALHIAVLITLARHLDLAPQWLLVPMCFAVISAVHFFGMILVEQLHREHQAKNGLPVPPREPGARARTLLKLPTDYGVLCVSFLLLGAPLVFFGVYTLLAVASAGYLALIVIKWHRELLALDPSPRRLP